MPYTDPEKKREARRKYRAEHPDRIRAQKERWRRRHGQRPQGTPKTHCKLGHELTPENTYPIAAGKKTPKCKTCARIKHRENYVPHPKTRKSPEELRRANGWTHGMYETTLKEQGNLCAICRLPFDRPCADHKHTTPPEPRGILCNGCNTAIGLLKESPEICRAAADYLEAWA